MDIKALYLTSPAAEEQGIWVENGDVEFKIARSGNRTYTDMFAQQWQAHKHTLDQRDTKEQREVAEERATTIQVDVMATSILLGWRGKEFKDAEGNVTRTGKLMYGAQDITGEYSVANAAMLLKMKEFRSWVNGRADDFKLFLVSAQKEDEKN